MNAPHLTMTTTRASCVLFYLQYLLQMSVQVYGFEWSHDRAAIRYSVRERFHANENDAQRRLLHFKTPAVAMENIYSDLLPNPNPTFQAIDVVHACMDTFIENRHDSKVGLDVCFAFSNDRCRAAIGGNINEFYQYATNPTFTYLTSCVSYRIISMGPIIQGTTHRGSMQTVLIDVIPSITTSMIQPSSKPSQQYPSKTNTKQQSSNQNSSCNNTPAPPRRFLWTLQQERRPPLQHCWMIHEVLYTKNAFQQTL